MNLSSSNSPQRLGGLDTAFENRFAFADVSQRCRLRRGIEANSNGNFWNGIHGTCASGSSSSRRGRGCRRDRRTRVASAQRLGAGYGIEKFESDYRKMLRDPSIDAVHICTPNALHFSMTKDALLAGKHVLCEKPLSTSIETAEELVQLAAIGSCAIASATICATTRWCSKCAACAKTAILAAILMSRATTCRIGCWMRPPGIGASIPKLAANCATMGDIGTHWFDMAEHVTGLRVRSLCADLQTFYPTRQRPTRNVQTSIAQLFRQCLPAVANTVAVNTEDFGAVLFHMDEGARGTMVAVPDGRGTQESTSEWKSSEQKHRSAGTRSVPMNCGSDIATARTGYTSKIPD